MKSLLYFYEYVFYYIYCHSIQFPKWFSVIFINILKSIYGDHSLKFNFFKKKSLCGCASFRNPLFYISTN